MWGFKPCLRDLLCACASSDWAPHPAYCTSQSDSPLGPPCLAPWRDAKPSAHSCLYIISPRFRSCFSSFSQRAALCSHFSPFSDFPDRPGLFLWWMSLIISFQSQEEERGGSQFRGITLTGETVSPWLPRGNGAEMDSCYKRRGGDNWWCSPAWWLHFAFPSVVSCVARRAVLTLSVGHILQP